MKQVDTILLVRDIKKSDEFYRNIFGLEVLHNWEVMMVYKNRLAIHQIDKIQPEEFAQSIKINDHNNVIVYIELDINERLEDILNLLKDNSIKIIHGIYALPWQRIIRCYDPDGNIVEIGEPSSND